METLLTGLQHQTTTPLSLQSNSATLRARPGALAGDRVDFGQTSVSPLEAQQVVLERALNQLRAVVDGARAELGIPEGSVLDTSPEATAQRIADFGLGAFDAFRNNHQDLGDEDARRQFADFIGGAIDQGIQEARDILTALSVLSPEIGGNVDKTALLVHQRLEDFVANGN